MGDNTGSKNSVSGDLSPRSEGSVSPSHSSASQTIQKTPRKRRKGRRSKGSASASEYGSPEEEGESIKYRLRNNSEIPTTPKGKVKKFKDSTSESNVKYLKKIYQDESKSMQKFLIGNKGDNQDNRQEGAKVLESKKMPKDVDTAANDDNDSEDTEIVLREAVEQQRDTGDSGRVCELKSDSVKSGVTTRDKAEDATEKDNDSMEAGTVYKAGDKSENSVEIGKVSKKDTQKKKVMDKIQKVEREVEVLENKLASLHCGSIEHMLLEMRIDIKKDNIAILEQMKEVTENTTQLTKEVEDLKSSNKAASERIAAVEETQKESFEKVEEMTEQVGKIDDRLHVLQGFVHKQDQQTYLRKKEIEREELFSMRDNLIISGLDEDSGEEEASASTTQLVTDFFSQTMRIGAKVELQSAQRIGKANPRSVLVQLKKGADKKVIFEAAKNLKDVKNSKDGDIFINNQLPPALQEMKRRYRALIKYNNSLASGKLNMEMKKGVLYIEGRPYESAIRPPGCAEAVFPLDEGHVRRTIVTKGDEQRKGNCFFIGYSVEVMTVADMRAAYTKITQLNPSALHIACAYRIPGVDFVTLRGYEDDGEHGAGRTLYKLLDDADIFHRAIFVVRYYGNKHLGPAHFQMYTSAAKTAITRSSYNSILAVHQSVSKVKAKATDVSRKVNTVHKGYAAAASPRPFIVQHSWGSMEFVDSTQEFRGRASSLDSARSAISYKSCK